MTDVWTSVGVIVGVALVFATGWLRLDPLVALAVAAHIVWTGVGLVRRSAAGLLDAAIPQGERDAIQKMFDEYRAAHGVTFHAFRTRRAAARRFVSFHLLVPDAWTVSRAHRLSEEIEARIRDRGPECRRLHPHRADLRPRFLRGPGPRPLSQMKRQVSSNVRRGLRGGNPLPGAVADVDQEIRLAAAVGEERGVGLGVVEAGHRAAIQADRAQREQEVAALQACRCGTR